MANTPRSNPQDEQIEALASIVEESRTLINSLVETHADAKTLQHLKSQLADINKQLEKAQTGDQQRPLSHFNFQAIHSKGNDVLPYSLVTGHYNPISAPMQISYDTQTQRLEGQVLCRRAYEGPPGMVHGAYIAGMYDQVLALASVASGKAGPTAYLNTQFLKPTPLHQTLRFSAWIDKIEGRKVFVKGQCDVNGDIVSTADALCIVHKPS